MRNLAPAVLLISACGLAASGCSPKDGRAVLRRGIDSLQALIEGGKGRGAGKAAPSGPAFTSYAEPNGLFSAEIGSDWTVLADSASSVPGVQFLSPIGPEAPAVRKAITAAFYAEGRGPFPDEASYIRGHRTPLENRTYTEVSTMTVAGRTARCFSSEEPLPGSPEQRPKGRSASLWVVVPADGGYFALRYAAPVDEFARFEPVFRRFLATFRSPA